MSDPAEKLLQAPAIPKGYAALSGGGKVVAINPQNFEDACRMGNLLAKSNLVPKDYQGKPEDCTVAILRGMEVGFSPLAALESIAVINGRACIWGDGALALVRASGLMERFEETDNGEVATCTVKRRGEDALARTFSMTQATKAGLPARSPVWKQYPERMRQMRARSWALRDGFADVLKGLYIAEEAQDIPEMRDITPQIQAKTIGQEEAAPSEPQPAPAPTRKRKSSAQAKRDGDQDKWEALRKKIADLTEATVGGVLWKDSDAFCADLPWSWYVTLQNEYATKMSELGVEIDFEEQNSLRMS